MAAQFNKSSLFSVALLLCCSFISAAPHNGIVLDRSLKNTSLHYIPIDDCCSFIVDRPAMLIQMDLPKVFGPNKENIIDRVPFQLTIREVSLNAIENHDKVVLNVQGSFGSIHESKIRPKESIPLRPDFEYIVAVNTLKNTLTYNDNLTINEFIGETNTVNFYQYNVPKKNDKQTLEISQGMVKRLHLINQQN